MYYKYNNSVLKNCRKDENKLKIITFCKYINKYFPQILQKKIEPCIFMIKCANGGCESDFIVHLLHC